MDLSCKRNTSLIEKHNEEAIQANGLNRKRKYADFN